MDKINDYMFVFYWRPPEDSKYHDNPDEWRISQPVSLGEIIDGYVEFNFNDGGSLPISDVDWGQDRILVTMVPPRTYSHTTPPIKGKD